MRSLVGAINPVDFRALNVRVLLSNQNLAGYEVLPIAQIKRASEQEAAPQLDKDYIPPVVAVEAWPVLQRDYVRAIYDMIGEKISVLAEQVMSRGITLATQEPGDLERLLMLMTLNEAHGSLRVLVFAKGVHPLVMYTELCRIVGSLSIFSKQRTPGEIPTYDHDDLARIFKWVKKRISELIYAVREYAYEQRFFVGTGRGMQVSLEPKWLNPTWDWYVGVHRGNITEMECRELLNPGTTGLEAGKQPAGGPDVPAWRAGTATEPAPPGPECSARGRMDLLSCDPRRSGLAGRSTSQTLAMRLRDELVQHRELLEGSRDLTVSSRGKQATLQFALFAVPKS
jgi:type VI secretion system protein ImpJ